MQSYENVGRISILFIQTIEPLFIPAPVLIPISPKVKIVPEGAQCSNYAFDVTPAKYISKLITEKGIIDANLSSISKLKN